MNTHTALTFDHDPRRPGTDEVPARPPRQARPLPLKSGVRAGAYEIIREYEHPWF